MNRRCFFYSFPHILGFLSFFSFPLCRLFTDIQRSSIHQFESRFWSKHRDDVGCN
ncbi:hypothetical protein Hanom_Chr05g00442861 [Helianthus anomalus]